MQGFKKLSTARKYHDQLTADDKCPIIRIGDMYLVGANCLTECAVIADDGCITGHVSVKHLDRLGNANWAETKQPISHTAF